MHHITNRNTSKHEQHRKKTPCPTCYDYHKRHLAVQATHINGDVLHTLLRDIKQVAFIQIQVRVSISHTRLYMDQINCRVVCIEQRDQEKIYYYLKGTEANE